MSTPLPDEQCVAWWEWQEGKRPPGWTEEHEQRWRGTDAAPSRTLTIPFSYSEEQELRALIDAEHDAEEIAAWEYARRFHRFTELAGLEQAERIADRNPSHVKRPGGQSNVSTSRGRVPATID